MANILIAYQNRAPAGTLSGGSFTAGLPLTNLQEATIGITARTTGTDLASTQCQIDLGSDYPIRVITFRNHNLSLDARYRFRGYSDSGLTVLVADTGWSDVWPAVYPFDSLDFEASNWWSGKYLAEEIEGVTPELDHLFSDKVRARYWLFEFDDTGNTDGFIEAGRLFMGDGWSPTINPEYGACSIGWETGTTVTRAKSGAKSYDRQTPYRTAKFVTGRLTEDEAFSSAFEIQRRMGLDGEVVFIFDPDDTIHAFRRRFLGALSQLSPIDFPYMSLNATAWQIEESL